MQYVARSLATLSDFGDDPDECFSQATKMIFIYYISWQVWIMDCRNDVRREFVSG